jgi:alcohol dehydrogenase
MKANGSQLQEITALIESGAIYPVIDRIFPFSSINDAFIYLDTGRAKGKLVIKVI